MNFSFNLLLFDRLPNGKMADKSRVTNAKIGTNFLYVRQHRSKQPIKFHPKIFAVFLLRFWLQRLLVLLYFRLFLLFIRSKNIMVISMTVFSFKFSFSFLPFFSFLSSADSISTGPKLFSIYSGLDTSTFMLWTATSARSVSAKAGYCKEKKRKIFSVWSSKRNIVLAYLVMHAQMQKMMIDMGLELYRRHCWQILFSRPSGQSSPVKWLWKWI